MENITTTTTTEEAPPTTTTETTETTGTTEEASQTKKDRLPVLTFTIETILPEGLTEELLEQVNVKVSSDEFEGLVPVYSLKDLVKFGILRNARSSIVKAKNAGITSGEFEPENMKKAPATTGKVKLEKAKEEARQEERANFRASLLAQGFPEEQVNSILASMEAKPASQPES